MNIDALLDVMARLRDKQNGCPWDIEQSFATIAPYTIEEAYEVADAIERNDLQDLKEELGDLLLQVVFHAQMASEQGVFGFADVVEAIVSKMVSRHPHVFGTEQVEDAQKQTELWEEHKRKEREARGDSDTSALAGISTGIPEWQRAIKLQKRAARTGFEWPDPAPVMDKLREEIDEVAAELDAEPRNAGNIRDEIGDVLFVAVNLARHAGVDPGVALRAANRKFEQRFRAMEKRAESEGGAFGEMTLSQMENLWQQVKTSGSGKV